MSEPDGTTRGPQGPDPEPPFEAPPAEVFVRWGLLFYGVLAAAAVVWRLGFQEAPLWYATPAAAERADPWHGAGLGLACGLALVALSEAATRWSRWGERLTRALAERLAPLSIPNACLLASASGLAEELFFRGALQPVAGWVAASLLFGALHFVPRRELLPWTVFAIGAGFLFGDLYDRTGSLTAPVVAHVVVNAVNLPRLSRWSRATPVRPRER